MSDPIIFTPYFKKSGKYLKAQNYITSPYSDFITLEDLSDLQRELKCDIEVQIKTGGKHSKIKRYKGEELRIKPEQLKEEQYYLKLLEWREKNEGRSTISDLNRIIRAGGLIEYIKNLEAK